MTDWSGIRPHVTPGLIGDAMAHLNRGVISKRGQYMNLE